MVSPYMAVQRVGLSWIRVRSPLEWYDNSEL
jgi:hypothetical protein